MLVAKMGGYLGRSRDPPPGHELIWKGYRRLQDFCQAFEMAYSVLVVDDL